MRSVPDLNIQNAGCLQISLNKFPGNFQETPGGISRKIQDMFALLRPAM